MGKINKAYLYKENAQPNQKVNLPFIGRQVFGEEGFLIIDESIAKNICDNTQGYYYKTKIEKIDEVKKKIKGEFGIEYLRDLANTYQKQLKIEDKKYKRISKSELQEYCLELLDKMVEEDA